METLHTPGPWEAYYGSSSGWSVRRQFERPGYTGLAPICSMAWFQFPIEGIITDEISGANARLIAAAPDLLAALHKLEWSAESPRYGRMCPACESLQSEGEHEPDCCLVAAIAKAEARQ